MSLSRRTRGVPRLPRGVAVIAHALGSTALLAQLTMPGLQSWHVAREGVGGASPAVDAPHRATAGGALGVREAGDATQHERHDGDTCPVCRLLAQSRGRMVLATQLVVGAHAIEPLPAAPSRLPRSSSHRSDASPRAPPRLA